MGAEGRQNGGVMIRSVGWRWDRLGKGMVGQGMVGQGMVGQGLVGQGMVGQGMVGQGMVGHGGPWWGRVGHCGRG